MIKFEEHEGQLFRMLEKPVQLAPDSKLPCLTRLIQDDSRMGMFNRDTKPSRLSDFYLAARIVSNNIVVDEFMESDYHRFEIIGYPVADGSKDWALYQMMQGEKVTKRHLINHIYWHYDARPHLKCISEYNCGTLQIMVLPEIWLTTAEPTGWQLYKEPKYKGGDWLEFIDAGGRKSQGKYLSNTDGNAIIVLDTASNMRCVVPTTKIIRKLSPSEVKVSITLDGTVIPENYESFFLKYDNTTYQYARIRYADLSPAYAALVRELTGTKGDKDE